MLQLCNPHVEASSWKKVAILKKKYFPTLKGPWAYQVTRQIKIFLDLDTMSNLRLEITGKRSKTGRSETIGMRHNDSLA